MLGDSGWSGYHAIEPDFEYPPVLTDEDGAIHDRIGGDRPDEAGRNAQAAQGAERANGEWIGQYSLGSVPRMNHSQ